jgi:hypothetical protein
MPAAICLAMTSADWLPSPRDAAAAADAAEVW